MADIMDKKTEEYVAQILNNIPNPVKIIFFTSDIECPYCADQENILKIVAGLSPKIELEIYDFSRDKDKVQQYKIDKVPATILPGEKNYGIRFFGVTGGHEFTSLINAIIMVSTNQSGMPPDLEDLVRGIKQPVHIEVMVTLSCPYCPQAVHAAHQLAFINPNFTSDMIESSEFLDLAKKYQVSSIPKTVINENQSFEGAMPVAAYFLNILKRIDPELYQEIEQSVKATHVHRHVKEANNKQIYDAIIIGGGPAAMSAAIYAVRKGLNVLLIAKEIGGQLTNTAEIDNYLGLPGISGKDLTEQFLTHLEQYPVAESLGAAVIKIEKKDNLFTVRTDAHKNFKSYSVIYSAGKEYKKLGVPGEEKFIGHGIAFCATCDAPLYKDLKVAVIGSGNSAFTSIRDLLGYADEVYLINKKNSFNADISLVEEIQRSSKVKFYNNSNVTEFSGNKVLEEIRVKSNDKKENFTLKVNGVFLEIGLTPNVGPLEGLLKLNNLQEIPIQKDNSTELPGFFAAGDVTDVREKQIIIAAGEGAKAAISAYNYLIDNKFIQKELTSTIDSY